MKRVIIILGVLITNGLHLKYYSQSSSNQSNERYLVMQVNSDILDCPHFGSLIKNISENKLNLKIIDVNPKEKYWIAQINNLTWNDEYIKNKFAFYLDSIHFPKSSIKEIKIQNNRKIE